MIYFLINHLIGFDRYRFSDPRPERIIELFLHYNVEIWEIRRTGADCMEFCASRFVRRRIGEICRKHSLSPELSLRGIPRIIKKYRRRWGILAGVLIFVLFLRFASGRIWGVRVIGREMDENLREQFASAGLREGMKTEDFDNGSFCADFLALNPDYSFVSAGIHGSTALVWLNERVQEPPIDEAAGGANLVAAYSGEIVRCEASFGQVQVKFGDYVQEGQLLVSGVVETKNGGFRIESSAGKVFARTEREFETKIPLQREEKHYTGREKTAKSVNILGKSINFFDFSANSYEFYDTINIREDVLLFGRLRMPFSVTRTTYAELKSQLCEISPQRAQELVYDEYYRFLNEDLKEAQVLSEEISVTEENGEVILKAKVSVIEDIAVKKEFSYRELLMGES